MAIRAKWDDVGYRTHINGDTALLLDEDIAILRQTTVLRVDPVNSCNALCVFCDSPFGERTARLAHDVYASALGHVAESEVLNTIQFGCTYEPTLHPGFARYGERLLASGTWRKTRVVSIVTNCWLLDRHDLEPFARAGLNKLHASIHGRDQATVAAVMGRAGRADRIDANLRSFKRRYPHVPVSVVCVITRLNMGSPLKLFEWLLDDVQVDYLRLTRAQISATKVGSPSMKAMAASRQNDDGRSYEVSDEEWEAYVAEAKQADLSRLAVIIGKQPLKNGAILVDSVRVRRADAVNEQVAMDRSRERLLSRG